MALLTTMLGTPAQSFDGAVTISGAATLKSTLSVSGAAVFKTSVTVEGTLSASATANFNTGIKLASTTLLTNYTEGTFTPTVTLVGGAGNTVPVYTTNSGRYCRVGRTVSVDINLTGDGGKEGAGTGQVNIALPIAASASHDAGQFMAGTALNNVTSYALTGVISGGGSTIQLSYFNLISTEANFTGADQNNATRQIRLKFSYEV